MGDVKTMPLAPLIMIARMALVRQLPVLVLELPIHVIMIVIAEFKMNVIILASVQ